VDTAAASAQSQQQTALDKRIENCHNLMKQVGAGFILLHTDQPYTPEIKKFFTIREKRRR
jgi:hypothetical protein